MDSDFPKETKFELGHLCATPGVLDSVLQEEMLSALKRHARGDWGELGPEDAQRNDCSVKEGSRILSAYRSSTGVRFWIITEGDRSATTMLLPEEY